MSQNKSEINLNLWPKQFQALNSDATEILYGGATRGGKSHFVRVALITWCVKIPGLQCDIFRVNFDDVIGNHMEGAASFPVLLAPWVKEKFVEITQTEVRFKFNGSLISLEHCADDSALAKHQGIEKHVRVFEEATQIKERYIRWLRAWVTMSKDMKDKVPEEWKGRFPKIIYTSNPIGVSAGYFRREFVNARPRYSIEQTSDKEGGFKRQYIPAKVEDNPAEDAEATRRRVSGIGDDDIADALLNENWDAPVGDFIRQWDEKIHRVPDFTPPAHWFKYRSFDWGGYDPFAVLWWCVSDGENFIDEYGRSRWFQRGSLIAYREWYGCQEHDTSRGLEMSNREIARGIVSRTPEVTSGVTITDNLPFQRRGDELMAETFAKNGCPLVLGNTDRIMGWKQLKDMLVGKDGWPLLYFTESCKYCADYIPALQRHKTKVEDAQEDGEPTHICDTIRLACLTRPLVRDAPKSPVTPKQGYSNVSVGNILNSIQAKKNHGVRFQR